MIIALRRHPIIWQAIAMHANCIPVCHKKISSVPRPFLIQRRGRARDYSCYQKTHFFRIRQWRKIRHGFIFHYNLRIKLHLVWRIWSAVTDIYSCSVVAELLSLSLTVALGFSHIRLLFHSLYSLVFPFHSLFINILIDKMRRWEEGNINYWNKIQQIVLVMTYSLISVSSHSSNGLTSVCNTVSSCCWRGTCVDGNSIVAVSSSIIAGAFQSTLYAAMIPEECVVVNDNAF